VKQTREDARARREVKTRTELGNVGEGLSVRDEPLRINNITAELRVLEQ
jgi:hypothetical protein